MKSKEVKRQEAVARNMKNKPRYIKEAHKALGFKEGQELNEEQEKALNALVNHKIGIPKVLHGNS